MPGLESGADMEGVAFAAAFGQRKQKIVGLVSPIKDDNGAQRLIWGRTYRLE